MTKTENSPPEEGGSGENLDESGPMWDELVRLLGDEEAGRGIHRQLKTAMKSQKEYVTMFWASAVDALLRNGNCL